MLLSTAHFTHSFAGLQTYGLRIRPAKPSHTAGTLCDMCPKFGSILPVLAKFSTFLHYNACFDVYFCLSFAYSV
jgi:hypothetical protein